MVVQSVVVLPVVPDGTTVVSQLVETLERSDQCTPDNGSGSNSRASW